MLDKSIQGWSIEFGIELFGTTTFIELIPFKWRMPFCAVPNGEPAMAVSPHMYLGPIHIWIFSSGAMLGLTVDIDHNRFVQDKLTLSHGMKRIF